MDLNVFPLLATIANDNNLGVNALRHGDRRAMHSFDSAISRFRGAIGEIRAAFQSKNETTIFSSFVPALTELQHDTRNRGRRRRPCRIALRSPSTHCAEMRCPGTLPRSPNAASISVQPSSTPRNEYSMLVHQTRNGGLSPVEVNESATGHIVGNRSRKIGYVHEEAIMIDLNEMRDVATTIMSLRILSSPSEGLCSHKCGECILRKCLINLSVIIVYNLGLAYHLMSRKLYADCESLQQIATNSRSLLASRRKAQILYSVALRNMIRLPSLKYKLVLLNNMGQVYLDQNLPERAKKCFEAVCRQVTRALYACSGRNFLIPQSSPINTNDNVPDFVVTELVRCLMITAIRELLPDPHAAVA